MSPPEGPRLGLCLKTTRSNLLQDADISRSCTGGQVGSRLPVTRFQIKTAWADPADSGWWRRERRSEGEKKKTTGNTLLDLQCIQAFFFLPFHSTSRAEVAQVPRNICENDCFQVKKNNSTITILFFPFFSHLLPTLKPNKDNPLYDPVLIVMVHQLSVFVRLKY